MTVFYVVLGGLGLVVAAILIPIKHWSNKP